eukprot:CAMPEP_0181111708 /NCGR_PEP_ID=MMETSP1071-20121207/19416_1 /TAXON_ID=35127 /ORGANISM="Thalassiosira sp., Strain NH16" /LENGTH=58 /DNA_ID=CAMNT_0023195613 /DNA_START=359 /DNA_END=532 /DNA_ORIENTATION=+
MAFHESEFFWERLMVEGWNGKEGSGMGDSWSSLSAFVGGTDAAFGFSDERTAADSPDS